MIIIQGKFRGDSNLIKNDILYGIKIQPMANSIELGTYHFSAIRLSFNIGEFPNYQQIGWTYPTVEEFFRDWQIIKINSFDIKLPNFGLEQFKSLLISNLRESKIQQLV